jgi:integrase
MAPEDDMKRKGQQKGTVRARGDKWYIEYREMVADESGTLRWRSTSKAVGPTTGPERLTKHKAWEKGYREFVAPANGLTITPGGTATVAQFIDLKFRPDCMIGLAKGTLDTYEGTLSKHIIPALGHVQLRDVSRSMVQTLISAKTRSGLSTESIRRVRNLIRLIFKHAKRLNYFAGELPTEDLVMPRQNAAQRNPLTAEQVDLIKSFCDGRTRLLIDFLRSTGVRISEASGLRWDAINLTDSDMWHDGERVPPFCAFICRQYTRAEMKTVKTSKSRRMVPLTTSLAVQLLEWSGKRYETVFAGRGGRPLSGKNHLRRVLAPAAVKAGVPGIGWHHFRHTTATATDTVLTEAQRMSLLGHTRKSTTMHYTKADLEEIRVGLERIQ